MSQSSTPNVSELFQNAGNEGVLDAAAMGVFMAEDLGAQIQAGLGIDVDDVVASEVVLVTMLVDDSGSIRFVQGNAQAVRDGHNLVLDALNASKQNEGVIISTQYLNGYVLYPYVTLGQAVRMDNHNYDPNGGTPLYDQTIVILGTVAAKMQEFSDNGIPCRCVTLIVTDGADQHSRRVVGDCKKVVDSLLRTEQHIIAGMGIEDGQTDFTRVFKEMGILSEWVLTASNNASDIRRAFQVFSQSAVRASQGAASFSRTAMGGFGTN